MPYDNQTHEVRSQNTAKGFNSVYNTDRARAEEQIRRKLGSAYFYLRPEEKKEYIRSYFRKTR